VGLPISSEIQHAVTVSNKERERKRAAGAKRKKNDSKKPVSVPAIVDSTISSPPPVNTWIDDVIKKWDNGPISSIKSLHSVGLTILKKLASLPETPASVPGNNVVDILGDPTRGHISPNLRLVINDLLVSRDHNVVDFLTRNSEYGISGHDILVSVLNPLIGLDMDSSERRLYGALDIRLGNLGIALCQYKATPYVYDKSCMVHETQWTVTLTPPGAITHTHMDYYGRRQFFVHLFGEKIWLLWPPTKKNLDIFRKYHTETAQADLTARCIDELEGLEVFHVKKEQAFVLKPNVLHACMSIHLSSHLGGWLWRMADQKSSLSMVDWGLDWLSEKMSKDAPISDYKEDLNVIKSEIDAWKQLVKKNKDDKEAKEVRKRLQDLEQKFSFVKGLFNYTLS